MKKLMMIAAAMTIAGGAIAQCGDPEIPDTYCALVYKVKMNLKTTVAKSAVAKYDCEDDEILCYRETGKVNLVGYAYTCDCSCYALMEANILLWDKKTKDYYIDDEPVGWQFINVIGKKSNKVEGAFMLSSEYAFLVGAGFGSFDTKNYIVKNMSGNVAGYGSGPSCLDVDCEDFTSGAYVCEDDGIYWDETVPTVYFGSFAFSYSKNDSKKQATDAWYIYSKVPDYKVLFGNTSK